MSESPYTIFELIQLGIKTLTESNHEFNPSDTPKLDSEILLLKVLNDGPGTLLSSPSTATSYTKTWLLTWPETTVENEHVERFKKYLKQRSTGMPIAYITGTKDFWSFTLDVTSDTLIPRPETELLVESALEKIPNTIQTKVLDLGTGSGAIALAIASERENSSVLATDTSEQALTIARCNASKLILENVSFCQSHWFNSIPKQQFDVIISNPPYIAEDDPHLEASVRHFEPLAALLADSNGLANITEIIETSQQYLKPSGWLLFEHGFQQAEAIQQLFKQSGFIEIQTLNDLGQQPRITCAQLPK